MHYPDEYQASCVLMLEAAGYPDKLGALSRVSEKTKVNVRTLRRWWLRKNEPERDKVVRHKKMDLVAELTELLGLTITAAKREVNEANYRELATAIGILTDKLQLLTGNPTERIETNQIERIRENRDGYPVTIRDTEPRISA